MSVFLCVIVVFNYFCWMIQGAKHEDCNINRYEQWYLRRRSRKNGHICDAYAGDHRG